MIEGTAYITSNNFLSYQPYDVTRPTTVNFDPSAPPVLLPEGVFTPLSAHNTIYHYRALWALLTPVDSGVIPNDLLRGYLSQRLLWELGDHTAIFPPNALNAAPLHSANMPRYTGRGIDRLHISVRKLLVTLSEWNCPGNYAFYKCVVSLSQLMVDTGFVQSDFVDLTKAWLEDLTDIGYEEPKRKIKIEDGNPVDLRSKRFHTLKHGSPVQFVPVEQLFDGESLYSQVKKMCSDIPLFRLDIDVNTTIPVSKHIHTDILLIIIFNHDDWYEQNVKVLEVIYRKMFPNMIYCGWNQEKFLLATSNYSRKFSFVESPQNPDYFAYLCVSKAIEMSYGVSGYLAVADDMIVSSWKIASLDKTKVWTVPLGGIKCDLEFDKIWRYWNLDMGKKALFNALNSLETLNHSEYETGILHPNVFLDHLKIDNSLKCYKVVSDIYYIPKSLKEDFVYYFKHFGKFSCFQELVVPMVTKAVVNDMSDVEILTGKYLWKANHRTLGMQTFYSPGADFFIHPMKRSHGDYFTRLCHRYLIDLVYRVSQ